MRRTIVGITLATFVITASMLLAQRDKSQRPSPPGTAEVTLGGKKVTIDYSRPKTADPKTGQPRKIMGGIVPYGKVWRTGANEATSLKTEVDLMIGTLHVPAGSYTLFSIPGEKSWTLIVNKQTGQWGTEYSQGQDFGRTEMQVAKTPAAVEQFTISFDKKNESTANLMLDWENTRAWVEVKAHGGSAAAQDDGAGVRQAVQHYFDGLRNRDVEALKKAFHPDAKLFGVRRGGELGALTQAAWYEGFKPNPDRQPPQLTDERVTIQDITGNAALVKVEMVYGSMRYTDYLSLLKLGDEWKIVNKIYYGTPVQRASN